MRPRPAMLLSGVLLFLSAFYRNIHLENELITFFWQVQHAFWLEI